MRALIAFFLGASAAALFYGSLLAVNAGIGDPLALAGTVGIGVVLFGLFLAWIAGARIPRRRRS